MLRGERPDTGSGPLTLPGRPRILLLRHDRIGDAIVSTPIVSLLRERYPDATIGMLLGRKNRAAAGLLGGVDTVHVLESDPSGYLAIARALRACRYDLVVNLLAKDSASGALLTTLSGARFRIGFSGEASSIYDRAVSHPDSPEHIVSKTSRLLTPLGIEPIGAAPARPAEHLSIELPPEHLTAGHRFWESISPRKQSRRVVVNISASSPSKLWSDDATRDLLDALRSCGETPVAAADPGDRERLEGIVRPGGHTALPVTASLPAFCGLLAPADIVITPDTSVVHIAAALGRPVVMLSAGSAAGSWYPWGVPYRIVGRDLEPVARMDAATVADAYFSLRTETERHRGASPLI